MERDKTEDKTRLRDLEETVQALRESTIKVEMAAVAISKAIQGLDERLRSIETRVVGVVATLAGLSALANAGIGYANG